jgi:hypothetical protein
MKVTEGAALPGQARDSIHIFSSHVINQPSIPDIDDSPELSNCQLQLAVRITPVLPPCQRTSAHQRSQLEPQLDGEPQTVEKPHSLSSGSRHKGSAVGVLDEA